MTQSPSTAWVYILKSLRNERYYVGYTTNLSKRLDAHNAGYVRSTRPLRPWILVYQEGPQSTAAARRSERYLKSLKSRVALERLFAPRVDRPSKPLLA